MNKMSIAWHEECQRNRRASIEADQRHLDQLTERLNRSKAEWEFCQRQIEEAKRQKLDAFDAERFCRRK